MEEKDYADELEDSFVYMYAEKYSLNQLNDIKNELINRNELESIRIIDRAINLKIANINREKQEENEFRRKAKIVNKAAFFSGLLGGLTSGKKLNNDLTSWEMQEMINNDLEEHNFDEEIIDEDDFYNDDLD